MKSALKGPIPVLEGLGRPVVEQPAAGRRIVTWFAVDEMERQVGELCSQFREAGWDAIGERSILFGLFREIDFQRGSTHRAIVVSHAPGMNKLNLVESEVPERN